MRSKLPVGGTTSSTAWDLFEAFGLDRSSDTVRPEEPCPHCGVPLMVHSGLEGERPKPGSHSMCTKCLGFMWYDEQLKLRKLTDAELAKLPQQLQDHLRELRALFMMSKTGGAKHTGGEA